MISFPAFTHRTSPNKWLISHGAPWNSSSKLCPCALFSLVRSVSLLTALGIPRFAGPSPKDEGDSKKRLHT
jgi:hypothetical protein